MKNTKVNNTLIIGIGNYGRGDDGLGWTYLDLLASSGCENDLEYRYQLQIEDAELISKYGRVIFVDATLQDLSSEYILTPLTSERADSFTSHAIPPKHILYLCYELYGSSPEAFMLAIKGFDFGLQHGLSKRAEYSLHAAYEGTKSFFTHKALIPLSE